MLKTCLTSFPVLIFAAVFLAAAAPSDQDVQRSIQALLMDRHPSDTPELWRGFGPTAPAVLIGLYNADTSTFHRMRLLEGLSAFADDPSAVDFIKQQAGKTSDDVIRNTAIRVMGNAQGAREEDFLSKFLSSDDSHTRLAAALALRKVGTDSARAKVDQFMSVEKTPWLLAKLNGEAVQPGSPLTPSGSSEDALNPDWAGVWRGFWISPKNEAAVGMKSEPVQLTLGVQNGSVMKGELAVKSKAKVRNLSLTRSQGKGSRWSGVWVEEVASLEPGAGSPVGGASGLLKTRREESPCEAEMAQQAGSFLMVVRLPRSGGVLVLRRDLAKQ